MTGEWCYHKRFMTVWGTGLLRFKRGVTPGYLIASFCKYLGSLNHSLRIGHVMRTTLTFVLEAGGVVDFEGSHCRKR